jgi:hypothetical protein
LHFPARGGVFFIFIAYTKSKRGNFFKTLRQNNAVLRRAALSGPKPPPDRARQGVFSVSPRALHYESRVT